MDASILQFLVQIGACFKWASGEFITTICGDQLYRALQGRRKTMKQVVEKIVLLSTLHAASAIISVSKCCPLGEALDHLGACQKVQVDHFIEEVNHWTCSVNLIYIPFLDALASPEEPFITH